jgi:hypothetical protein|tara:strand:+ start:809 stop:1024 length:216 start_codon:yes stop_codon:yes gene_type:complete
MHTRRFNFEHPELGGVVFAVYYEAGTREEPPYVEIEKVFDPSRNPGKDIGHLFNLDAVMDDFWRIRPDLEG